MLLMIGSRVKSLTLLVTTPLAFIPMLERQTQFSQTLKNFQNLKHFLVLHL